MSALGSPILIAALVLGTATASFAQCADDVLRDQFSYWAKADAEGARFVVAVSLFDFGPSDVYLLDRRTGSQIAVATDAGASDETPDASRDFELVAFVSDGDYAGSNADGGLEVFVYEVATSTITQVTDGAGNPGVYWLDLTDDGTRVHYWREAPGGVELRRVTLATLQDEPLRLFTGNFSPYESESTGNQFALWSDEDWTGGNPDGSQEIFVYDVPSDTFTQLTDSPITNEQSWWPSSDGELRRVAFLSEAEYIVGPNPAGLDLPVVLDRDTGLFTVLGTQQTYGVVISRDGTAVITRRSDGEIVRHHLMDGSTEVVAAANGFNELFRPDDDGGWIPFAGEHLGRRQLRLAHCLVTVFEDGFESGDTTAWSTTVP